MYFLSLRKFCYSKLLQNSECVDVVNYFMSDHMLAMYEIICEDTKTEAFKQKYVQDFSIFDVGVFLNSLRMKLQNMRLYAECCEGVNKFWDEFEAIFNGSIHHQTHIKVLNEKEQKLKAKPWLKKGLTKSINNKNLIFKFAIKNKQKSFLFHLKNKKHFIINK